MKLINSIEHLKELIAYIPNLRKGYITNFFLNEEKHKVWIETNQFFYMQYEDCILLLFNHKEEGFANLFYYSVSLETLKLCLKQFIQNNKTLVTFIDIVGREVMCTPVVDIIKSIGGKEETRFIRMSKIGKPTEITVHNENGLQYATTSDLIEINMLLHNYFDKQLEQLPLQKELEQMVENKSVIRCIKDDKVAGILIFDRTPSTLHLRYWLTLPDFRNRGIGSVLLRRFLLEGKDTNRQILWVMKSNENAIMRYEHYGFKSENMFDYIMRLN